MAASRSAVSNAVIVERLDNLKAAVDDLHTDVGRRFDTVASQYVRRDLYDAQMAVLQQSVSKLQATNTWILRAVGGFVFTAISGVIAALVTVHR